MSGFSELSGFSLMSGNYIFTAATYAKGLKSMMRPLNIGTKPKAWEQAFLTENIQKQNALKI